MERLRRDELNSQVARFGIDMSDRMLQHALKGVGIRPTYEGVAGGKGKTSWFEPIDAYVIATAVFGRAAAWTSEAIRLDRLHGTYEQVAGLPDAQHIPGFLEDRSFGMKLLYVTQLEGGFPLLQLQECLLGDTALYELTRFGPEFLRIWLTSYVRAYGETWSAIRLPEVGNVNLVEAADRDELQLEHFKNLVGWAAAMFQTLSSESGRLDEGGGA